MRAWLRRFWSGRAGLPGRVASAVLFPLELIYRGVVGGRNRGYDVGVLPTREPPIPVISVGNVAVGGTGKTPFSGWLVSRLEEMGRRPALVTRGYGSDEVLLHRAWNPQAVVIADVQRLRGVCRARERGADVAVLDDGFQHRAIGRRLDIVLVASEHGSRQALLPRGRLRETFRALRRADAVVVTRKTASRREAARIGGEVRAVASGVLAQVGFEVASWTDFDGTSVSAPGRGDLLAVAGVADPEPFTEMVRQRTTNRVTSLAFRDHHVFRRADVARIAEHAGGRSIVTTEKDAVKLREFAELLPETYVLRLRVAWESGHDDVMALVRDALRSG